MDSKLISGLHHVTALSSDAQENLNFYAGVLGLRMVKKTVNFDDPYVYHLYYGDYTGSPGSLMTFFPYHGMMQGVKGRGQLTVTSFSVPAGSLDYWMKRLDKFHVEHSKPAGRFDSDEFIYFEDHDGLGIELVESGDDEREGFTNGHIPPEYAIKGFYGVTLSLDDREKTGLLLTEIMNHNPVNEQNGRIRFSPSGKAGALVDLVRTKNGALGRSGSGTVHHVAYATKDEESQLEIREKLLSAGLNVTPVIDRQYFKSIYFREPGGVLFEVATLPPGMAIDEKPEKLGGELKLPAWEEVNRQHIEKNLGQISLDIEKFRK